MGTLLAFVGMIWFSIVLFNVHPILGILGLVLTILAAK